MHFFTEGSTTDAQMRSWLGSRYEHYRRVAQEARARRLRDEQCAQALAQETQRLREAEKRARLAEAFLLPGIISILLGLGAWSLLMQEHLA